MKTRNCLECGEVVKGRIDKKFCSDHCRNSFNNRANRDRNNLVRNTNNRLRRNYKILTQLCLSEQTGKVPRSILYDQGFDFHLFTSVLTEENKTLIFVYDYGYVKLENEMLLLIKKDN